MGVAVLALTGVSAFTINTSPLPHFACAGVLFVAFTLDVVCQLLIDQCRGALGPSMRSVAGVATVGAAAATLISQFTGNSGAMSVTEVAFAIALSAFWVTEATMGRFPAGAKITLLVEWPSAEATSSEASGRGAREGGRLMEKGDAVASGNVHGAPPPKLVPMFGIA
jgi:hypothetical protein